MDAIVDGELTTIERLRHANPHLIRARSPRQHHATLLHYVGAASFTTTKTKTQRLR